MSIARGQPRQVYRVYDEEDFLDGAQRPEGAPDRPETQPPPGFPDDPPPGFPDDPPPGFPDDPPPGFPDGFPSGDAEMELAITPPLSGARRHSARPRVILAAGVALVVFAAIEMHASVGRVTRPVPARRPGLPAARRSRRAARRLATATRSSSRRPDQAGAATTRGHELRLPTPAEPQPHASDGEGPAATAAATTSEFGFEQ